MLAHVTSRIYQPEPPFGPVTSCSNHVALLEAASRIPVSTIVVGRPFPKDIFNNPFIPTRLIAYLPHDFCKLDLSGKHVEGCDRPNPAVWRVLKDEKFTFVGPKKLGHFRELTVTAKPKAAYVPRFTYRPTLDEFMSNREQYRDSDLDTTAVDSDDWAMFPCEAFSDMQSQSRDILPLPKHARQFSPKPIPHTVTIGKANVDAIILDNVMDVDSLADTVTRSSSDIHSPSHSAGSPQPFLYDGDEDSGNEDDDDYELTTAKRKAKKQLTRAMKKVVLAAKVTSKPRGVGVDKGIALAPRPALQGTVNLRQPQRLYPCTISDCTQVCYTKGDLERHLQSKDHQVPSIPCPKGCGAMFTRADAAKRHAKHSSCGGKNIDKSKPASA